MAASSLSPLVVMMWQSGIDSLFGVFSGLVDATAFCGCSTSSAAIPGIQSGSTSDCSLTGDKIPAADSDNIVGGNALVLLTTCKNDGMVP